MVKKKKPVTTPQLDDPFLLLQGATRLLTACELTVVGANGKCTVLRAGAQRPVIAWQAVRSLNGTAIRLAALVQGRPVPVLEVSAAAGYCLQRVEVRLVAGKEGARWQLRRTQSAPLSRAYGRPGIRQVAFQKFEYYDDSGTVGSVTCQIRVSKPGSASKDLSATKPVVNSGAVIRPSDFHEVGIQPPIEDVVGVLFQAATKNGGTIGGIAYAPSNPGQYITTVAGRTTSEPANVITTIAQAAPPTR